MSAHNTVYTLSFNSQNFPIQDSIKLVSSKSESNRALIINAVSGGKCELSNVSEARDTQTMIRLLADENAEIWDVLDAGTTMRFLTAYSAIKGLNKVMTGTERMQERPIGILVDALRQLGIKIEYLKNDGFPPLKIHGNSNRISNKVVMKGDVSSQFISAILMNAPFFKDGLEVELLGKIASRPYLEMTLELMKHFGVSHEWKGNTIEVKEGTYHTKAYQVESDWSGASYWYSVVALAKDAVIELLGLKENSLQGDSVLVEIMQALGVKSEFTSKGVKLTKVAHLEEVKIDFSDCPDIAQTLAVIAAAKGIKLQLSGLESLRIKETDRIAAIQNELQKLGADMIELEEDLFEIKSAGFNVNDQLIDTYDDHRMAMAFAPLALIGEIRIDNPSVVNKSYPRYWEHLKQIGIAIKE